MLLSTCSCLALAAALGLPLTALAVGDEAAPAGANGAANTSLNNASVRRTVDPSLAEPPADESSSTQLEDSSTGRWRVEFNSWLWMMGVEGNVGARGRTADVSADFGDILDASDSLMAFSGHLEVGYGRFAGFVDGFYADLGADDQTGPGGRADVDVSFKQGIVDFGLMYRVGEWEPSGDAANNRRNTTLDLYAGARFNSVELGLDPANLESRSRSNDWFDPIVGAKLVLPLSQRWHLQANGDVGGFGVESDITWSTTAAFGYNFEIFGQSATVLAGYRAIGWDYSDGTGDEEFTFDVTQHGPILGFSIHF